MTNAELAILSLVLESPRHGYEIEQVIEERGMREWTEVGFSSIYYILRKLQEHGWVESHLQQDIGPGPARNVFHITQSGLAAWREATLAVLATPARRSRPLLLGLNNLPAIPREDALAALKQHRILLVEQRDHLVRRVREQSPLPYFVQAMFDYSLILVRSKLEWMGTLIGTLETKADLGKPKGAASTGAKPSESEPLGKGGST
jgi:DNA-binding PadR family transcriptional regulator